MSDIIDDVLLKRGVKTRSPGFDYKTLKNPDRWMTKEEAVMWMNVWRETCIPKYNLYYPPASRIGNGISSSVKNIYLNGLIDELIDRVAESPHDPITAVAEYNYEMDDILAMSDVSHTITHRFAGFMERASYEVLLFLKEKEKEMNYNECEKMAR